MATTATKSLIIKFITDSSKAISDTRRLNNEMRGLNSITGKMSTIAGGASYQLNALWQIFQAIPPQAKAAAAAFIAVGYSIKKMIEHGLKAEGVLISLEVLTGSHTKAVQLWQQAMDYSRRTPFTPVQMEAATQQAVQYGIMDPFNQTFETLKKGANVSAMDMFAAFGSFTDMRGNLIGIERAMQGIMTGNLKMTRAFRGLIGAQWEAAKKETKAMGALVGSAVWGKNILKHLSKIPNVLDLTAKKADSVAGILSTIGGFPAEIWRYLSGVGAAGGTTFWTNIRSILMDVRDGLQSMIIYLKPFFQSAGEFLGTLLWGIWELIKAVWSVFGPVIKVVLAYILGTLQIIWEIFIGIIKVIITILNGIIRIGTALLGWFININAAGDALKMISNDVQKMVLWLEMMFFMLNNYLKNFFNDAEAWIKDLGLKFVATIEFIYNTIVKYIKKIKDILPEIKMISPEFDAEIKRREEEDRKKGLLNKGTTKGTSGGVLNTLNNIADKVGLNKIGEQFMGVKTDNGFNYNKQTKKDGSYGYNLQYGNKNTTNNNTTNNSTILMQQGKQRQPGTNYSGKPSQ